MPVRNRVLKTKITDFTELLLQKKTVSIKELAKKLDLSFESVEQIGKALEKQGVVDVQYPATMVQGPRIVLKKELPVTKKTSLPGELIEEYSFEVDFIPIQIRILTSAEENRPIYELQRPIIDSYTHVFLIELKDEISEKIPIDAVEIIDLEKSQELKKRFFEITKKEIKKIISSESEENINILGAWLLQEMYGLGEIEAILGDDSLEEIAINSAKTPITVYHRKHGWMKSNITIESEEKIKNYASQIGRNVGREITNLAPILDAHLISGDRVNATLNPISSFGNTITIRKFSKRPWTITDFIGDKHTMNIEMASILWMAMQYEMNIIVAGGTASGKTSTLNSLSAFIPSYHRVISIEDVREIVLPDYMRWNWVPTTTRNPNPEGKGEIGMLHLLQSSLRMRPDRIIVGEIRKKEEAEVLFEAMHTGHSVYGTIHADSARQILRRLLEPPIALPPLMVEAIDLLLVQYRDRKTNVRRTFELSEIETGTEDEHLSVNTIFKYDPRQDDWEAVNPASKFIRQLNLHTGMTEEEITKELMDRAKILKWMKTNKITELNEVGKVMEIFYSTPEVIKKAAKKNLSLKEVLGA